MKTFAYILRTVSSVILMILSFAFTVIEACMFIGCDFLLYEFPLIATVQIYLRLLLALGAFIVSLLSVIRRDRDLTVAGGAMLIASFIIAPFLSNGFGIYIPLVTSLFAASAAFDKIIKRRSR